MRAIISIVFVFANWTKGSSTNGMAKKSHFQSYFRSKGKTGWKTQMKKNKQHALLSVNISAFWKYDQCIAVKRPRRAKQEIN